MAAGFGSSLGNCGWVARFDSDGNLDPTFSTDGLAGPPAPATGSGSISGLAIQSDGRVVVAGRFRFTGRSDNDILVARLLASGAPDPDFGTGGFVTFDISSNSADEAVAVAIQANGRIVVAGTRTTSDADFVVLRLTSLGAPDPSFGGGDGVKGIAFGGEDRATCLAIEATGSILVGGVSTEGIGSRIPLARLRASDGELDATLDADGQLFFAPGFQPLLSALAAQADGRIVLAGVDDDDLPFVMRALASGAPDPTFGDVLDGDDEPCTLNSIVLQPDGAVVAAGGLNTGAAQNHMLIRITAAAQRDLTFGVDGVQELDLVPGDRDEARVVMLQPGGKLVTVVGGRGVTSGSEVRILRLE